MNWKELEIDVSGRTSGKIKTYCPKCRDSRSNKRDKSLSVDLDKKAYNCHYCQWQGYLRDEKNMSFTETPKKTYTRPKWVNKTEISESVVKYFEGRGISQKTLNAVRITDGKEFMPQINKNIGVMNFNYFLDGELVNVKSRTRDKHFKLCSGAELILYNIDAIKDSTEMLITEGEFDCLSYIEAGYPFAVSVPNGASENSSYLDNYFESHFDNKETVYIAVDNDKKGLALQKELIRRFGAERCKIIEYSGGCKDANEHLMMHGSESLKITVANAKDVKVDGVFTVMDFRKELDMLYEKGLPAGYSIGHPNFDRHCRFDTGRLLVCTGKPSSGKSEFIDEIVERLNMRYNWKAVYFSPENFPLQIHASKIMSKITGKKFDVEHLSVEEYNEAKLYMNDNFFFICPEVNYSLENILEKAKYVVRRKGVKAVIVDPWNRLEHQIRAGMSETNYISQQLDMMTNFAQQNDLLFILMAHPTKPQRIGGKEQVPTLYDISGSANFYNKTDFGITVERDRSEYVTRVHIQKVKFKHLGDAGTAVFKYNLDNGRYSPVNVGEPTIFDNTNHLRTPMSDKADENPDLPFTPNYENLPF